MKFKITGSASEIKAALAQSEFNEQRYADEIRSDIQSVKTAIAEIAGMVSTGCTAAVAAELEICSVGALKGKIEFELNYPAPVSQGTPAAPPADPPAGDGSGGTSGDTGGEGAAGADAPVVSDPPVTIPDESTVTAGDEQSTVVVPDGEKVEASTQQAAEGADAPVV